MPLHDALGGCSGLPDSVFTLSPALLDKDDVDKECDIINGGTGTRRRLAVEDNINSWIIDQMDETRTPATSHREYWRARANPSVSPFYLFELL